MQNRIHLEEVKSTNSWVLEQLSKADSLPDETVVWTTKQTAGRGQIGNSWEAEPDRNISFSVLLKPVFVHPREQFILSVLTAVSVAQTLAKLLEGKCKEPVSIKWPNDIYVGDEKICGMLLEHKLQGSTISHTVLGIGINVNQEQWVGNAPNPTSLKLKGAVGLSPILVLNEVLATLAKHYQNLLNDYEKSSEYLYAIFRQLLYRNSGFFPYIDAQTQEAFEAEIAGVESTGRLQLRTRIGELRSYWFKDVKFVLPCGTIKE